MAKKSLQEALDEVEMTYAELMDIAKDITSEFFQPIDAIIAKLRDVNVLSNDEIRNYMIQLSLAAYSLGETKEKSALKAEIAEAVRKENFAKNFTLGEGAIAVRENNALIESSAEAVGEALYNLVANLFKTKLDACHRVIDILKAVLMSRNMEAKLTANTID